MRKVLSVLVGLILVVCTCATGAQTFVAPKPESSRARAPSPDATVTRRAPRAAAPVSLCEQLTRDWADYRPVNDFPTAEGRTNVVEQSAALRECAAEQSQRPGDVRIAFLFARVLEVNNQASRAAALYRQLAEAGYTPAVTQLARAHHFGTGVARDQAAACRLYVDAANAGDTWAYNSAANCLSVLGSPPDYQLACAFFEKAQASNTFQSGSLSREDYCR
jgi:TPR repeat protein